MKKYFMKGTEDKLQFGDMIEFDFTKDMPNGNIKHQHLEGRFIPDFVPMLLEEGIIEEREVEDEVPSESTELEGMINNIVATNEDLELRIDKLEARVSELTKIISLLNAKLKKSNAKKTA